jgi:opacity protein-like surface antigen
MIMKKRISFFLFLACAGQIFSQQAVMTKTGTTAAPFLKIGVGARSIGMGGAFTAVSNDLSAMYWNPSGLARLSTNEASFHHINWIADINYDMAAVAMQIEGFGTLGASFTSMNVGEMDVTTTNAPEGTGERFSAGATLMSLSFARSLTDKFSIGFNLKFVREAIWNMRAQSVAVDFGTLYTADILNGVHIGASMSNFGAKMQLEGRDNLLLIKSGPGGTNLVDGTYALDSYDLPLMFRVGLSTDAINSDNNRITLAIDAVHPNDNTEYVNSGVEYTWGNIIALRGGWKSAFERGGEQGLTLGAGVHYTLSTPVEFLLDYAYQDFGRLKEVHYISFGLRY